MLFEEWLKTEMAMADIKDITSEIPDTINVAIKCVAELAYKAGQESLLKKKMVTKTVEAAMTIDTDGFREYYHNVEDAKHYADKYETTCVKLTGEYEAKA